MTENKWEFLIHIKGKCLFGGVYSNNRTVGECRPWTAIVTKLFLTEIRLNKAERGFSLQAQMQSHQRHESCTEAVTHPSTNVAHRRLTSVKDGQWLWSRHNSWKPGDRKKNKEKKNNKKLISRSVKNYVMASKALRSQQLEAGMYSNALFLFLLSELASKRMDLAEFLYRSEFLWQLYVMNV